MTSTGPKNQNFILKHGRLQPPCFHSPFSPGSAPQCPADLPGYRSRPRAHAAATSPPPPAGTGTRRYSGRSGGCIRRGGRRSRLPFSEKTGQSPGDPFQKKFQAGRGIVFQFRISPFRTGHHRLRSGGKQNGDMIQDGGHNGAELIFR